MKADRFGTLALLATLLLPATVAAQAESSRERDLHEWEVKAEKMRTHLLPTMREHGVDMWIIMSRENNPDPALELFGGYGISGWYGHRNAYVFYDAGDAGLETAAIGTHLSGHLSRFYDHILSYHNGEEGLAPTLAAYVAERDPDVIAINQSRTISMADGLSAELKDYLIEAVGPEYASRLTSSEPMFIDYVSHRTPAELAIAKDAAYRTWHILRRAFSSEVITPGQTTLMDVYWWVKDEWMAQDLEFNFPASFDLWREGQDGSVTDVDDPVIQPGDLLHVDFGVRLMGIVTDQQKMAYVLKPGEAAPPEGLQRIFEQSIRQGEIIAETIEPGVLGRDIVTIAEARGRDEGIDNRTYPHVQGNWVHGAGAWGARDWPERYGTHPRQPVRATEFWSIEYSVSGAVPEWGGQTVTMAREEDAWVDAEGQVHFMVGPQMELWLIGQPAVIY
jgi:Xaa-Pro aminopeptidase